MHYTEEHLWIDIGEDGTATVGITAYGAEQLGEVIFVELPEVGTSVSRDDEVAVIETSDEALDILAPLEGEIVEINEAIVDAPGQVNEDPEGAAWMFCITIEDPSALDDYMSEAAYKGFIRGS